MSSLINNASSTQNRLPVLSFETETKTLPIVPENRVHKIHPLYYLPLFPLRIAIWLWMRTLRYRISDESRAALTDISEPTVLIFWHNRLLIISEIFQRYRRRRHAYALISASKDGAWLAAFCALFRVRNARGSSSRRGSAALKELLTRLSSGNDAVVTPDGPRGPMYSFKPGAAALVQRSQARVLLIGSRSPRAWRLKSWDRFIIPRPFSTVELICKFLPAENLPSKIDDCATALKKNLLAINDE